MRFRLFQFAIPAPEELEELNAYLAQHRVVSIQQYMLPNGSGGILVFVVETAGDAGEPKSGKRTRVDYRERLSDEEFAAFSRLRDLRKTWADAEGVPVYTVFTNAQLAAIVERRPKTEVDLLAIEGIGEARCAKYGPSILGVIRDLVGQDTEAETDS